MNVKLKVAPLIGALLLLSSAVGVRAQSLNQSTSGSIAAASAAVTLGALNNVASVAIQVSGTWSATLAFEGTVDGTNYVSITAVPSATGFGVTSTTANGLWMAQVTGLNNFRVRASAYTSGTATVTLRKSSASTAAANWVNSTGRTSLIACDSSAVITVSAASSVKLVTGTAGKQIYVCGFSFSGDTTATVAQFTKGTGTNCATGTANVSGAYKLAANGTLGYGGGDGTIFAPIAASTDLCLAATTGAVAGTLSYTQF